MDSARDIHNELAQGQESSSVQTKAIELPSWVSSASALAPLLQDASKSAFDAFDVAFPEESENDMRITYFITWGSDITSHVSSSLQGGGGSSSTGSRVPIAGELILERPIPAELQGPASQNCTLITHVCALPARPQPPIHLLVRGAPRHNAGAKSSQWVKERAGLEGLLKAGEGGGLEEVILHSADGGLLEGLSTNVAAVQGGVLITPQEGVLLGTVRQVLLEVASTAGVPCDLSAPSVGQLASCTGVAVSSTSRLALPASSVHLPSALVMQAAAPSSSDSTTQALAKRSTSAWLQAALQSSGEAAAAEGGAALGIAPPLLEAELNSVFQTSVPGVYHIPHPSGDGGSFVFVTPPEGSTTPPPGAAELSNLTVEEADALPRMRYRVVKPATAQEHAVLDFFTTQVPPQYRGGGVAGKLAKGALDTTAALGARAKPSCSYLHATYVPRNLGYMDVVSEMSPQMVAAAHAALVAAGAKDTTAAADTLGVLSPSKATMHTSASFDDHVQVHFSLSPVSQLLAALVQIQVASHSQKVR